MPVKNEEWILPTTLNAASKIADRIIVANQNSTDKTREILSSNEKVTIVENKETAHSNKVRWKMLDYTREKFGTNNLILCLDADEILPPYLFKKHKKAIIENIEPGTIISSPWVQVWRTIHTYRKDNSVWNPLTNKKPFMFLDDGKMNYDRKFVINDHTSRVPEVGSKQTLEIKLPLLHLQFANWNRAQIKQAWYQCYEMLKGQNPEVIKQNYSITKDENSIAFEIVPEIWYKEVEISTEIEKCEIENTWYYKEIKEMFDSFGLEKFSNLGIWHIEELNKLRR